MSAGGMSIRVEPCAETGIVGPKANLWGLDFPIEDARQPAPGNVTECTVKPGMVTVR